ncbi:MAG TPA: DUF1573 domain-containing protein [Bacteroidia bacterium]|nr:DUF1573 domain-containing protein [Bacteroidia bacterium]
MKKFFMLTIAGLIFSAAYAQAPATKATAKNSADTIKRIEARKSPVTPAKAPAATTKTPAPATGAATADPGYKFDKVDHDYGTIPKGADPYCSFKLTNTGKTPLVIQSATGSCGCTVPEYPKEPIAPGQTITIKVRYDTNRPGPFEKQVTVVLQGKDQPAILKIHGKVEAPAAEQPFPAPGSSGNTGAPVNN